MAERVRDSRLWRRANGVGRRERRVLQRRSAESALERRAEAAMQAHLGRSFLPFVRPIDMLRELLDEDPYRKVRLAPGSKRVVTFVRGKLTLPIEVGGARILALRDDAVLGASYRRPAVRRAPNRSPPRA